MPAVQRGDGLRDHRYAGSVLARVMSTTSAGAARGLNVAAGGLSTTPPGHEGEEATLTLRRERREARLR